MSIAFNLRYFLAAASVCIALCLLTGCGEAKKPSPKPAPSSEAETQEQNVEQPEEAETHSAEEAEEVQSEETNRTPSASKPMPSLSELASKLEKDLIDKEGKPYSANPLAHAEYLAIYYSAYWCPPCRRFTPQLVAFYNEMKPKYPGFKLVFVSADHSEKAMLDYMKEVSMPWPALKYAVASGNHPLTDYEADGIPHLVFLDKEGKVLSSSVEDGDYVGPQQVLEDIRKKLEGK